MRLFFFILPLAFLAFGSAAALIAYDQGRHDAPVFVEYRYLPVGCAGPTWPPVKPQ